MTSPTVTLCIPTAADEDVLYRVTSDLDSWEQRTPRPPVPLTREAYRARRDAAPGHDDDVEFIVDADGTAVGRCALFGFDVLARHAEAGIGLLPEARGRGIGTAAMTALVDFGFSRRNLHRIHLVVLASNHAAIAAYAKVGFAVEGRRREHAWVRGEWVDEVVMGLLRADRP